MSGPAVTDRNADECADAPTSSMDERIARWYFGPVDDVADFELFRKGTPECAMLFGMQDSWSDDHIKRFNAYLRQYYEDSELPPETAEQIARIRRLVKDERMNDVGTWTVARSMRTASAEVKSLETKAPTAEIYDTCLAAKEVVIHRINPPFLRKDYDHAPPLWVQEDRAPTLSELLTRVKHGLGSQIHGRVVKDKRHMDRSEPEKPLRLDASLGDDADASATMHDVVSDESAERFGNGDSNEYTGRAEPTEEVAIVASSFVAHAFLEYLAQLPSRAKVSAVLVEFLRNIPLALRQFDRPRVKPMPELNADEQWLFDFITREEIEQQEGIFHSFLAERRQAGDTRGFDTIRAYYDKNTERLRDRWLDFLVKRKGPAIGSRFGEESLDALMVMLGPDRYADAVSTFGSLSRMLAADSAPLHAALAKIEKVEQSHRARMGRTTKVASRRRRRRAASAPSARHEIGTVWLGPQAINRVLVRLRDSVVRTRAMGGGVVLVTYAPGMEITAHAMLAMLCMSLQDDEGTTVVRAYASSSDEAVPPEVLALGADPRGAVLLVSDLPPVPEVVAHFEKALSAGLVAVATGRATEWQALKRKQARVLDGITINESVLTDAVAKSVPAVVSHLQLKGLNRLQSILTEAIGAETEALKALDGHDSAKRMYAQLRDLDAIGAPMPKSLLFELMPEPKEECERNLALLCATEAAAAPPLAYLHDLSDSGSEHSIVVTTAGRHFAKRSIGAEARANAPANASSSLFLTARNSPEGRPWSNVAAVMDAADYDDFEQRNYILRLLSAVAVTDRPPHEDDDAPSDSPPKDWLEEVLRETAGAFNDAPRLIGIAERVIESNAGPYERLAWALMMESFGFRWLAEELLEPLRKSYQPAATWFEKLEAGLKKDEVPDR